MIPLNEPVINGREITFIKSTIKKKWISTFGQYKEEFERKLIKITKSKNVVSVSSGTAALHLALRTLEIKKDEEVLVPSLTFIATVNAIKYVSANPVFMDVGNGHNLDVKKTIEFLNKKTIFKKSATYNLKTKKKISAIVIVHLWGNALDFFELKKICKKKNIYIVEDASEGLGTLYLKGKFINKHVGTIGDIGCLSFNGNKIITTGSGGAILTDNYKIAKKVRYLADQAKDNSIKYIHNDIGYNYRLPNLNAAFGCGQLKELNQYLQARKNNYFFYKNFINKISGLKMLAPQDYSKSNFWMNVLTIDSNVIKKSPYFFHKKLLLKGIQTRMVWKPNHLQKKYKNYEKYKVSNSQKIFDTSLCIPSSANLNKSKLKKICNSIKEIAIN
tara:strand:- start:39 stop:1202 length:1164 start_codon:yes stop_codon:yes gene_type:complete